MSILHTPTQTLPTLAAARRKHEAIAALNATVAATAEVVHGLCEHAPSWPNPATDADAPTAYRTATVTLIKYARRHHCPASNPARLHQLLRLAIINLDLWHAAKRYVQNPAVYPLSYVAKTVRLQQDWAAWLITGDARHLLR